MEMDGYWMDMDNGYGWIWRISFMLTRRFSNCHVNLYTDIEIHLIQDRKKALFILGTCT